MLLEGLHIPLTTPFHPDGRLHPHKLAANTIRYSKSPAQGLIALSPTAGEPTLLSDNETREALRTIAEAAAPEKVLIANISRDSERNTLPFAEFAAAHNYDCVLLTTPSVLRLGQRAIAQTLAYFRTVADRSPLPVVLLGTTGSPLSAERIAELATHPNILGLLDATPEAAWASSLVRETTRTLRREVTVTPTFAPVTGRMLRHAAASSPDPQTALVSATALARNPAAAATAVAQPSAGSALRTRAKTVGFQVLAASPAHLLASLTEGASGMAPAFAACAPQACYEVFAAWKDGDDALALEKQERLRSATGYAQILGPPGLKFGCDLNGYYGGPSRLPHLPLVASERAALQREMASLRT